VEQFPDMQMLLMGRIRFKEGGFEVFFMIQQDLLSATTIGRLP
jgi:hypothetical protein